jgi:hypothetical protein
MSSTATPDLRKRLAPLYSPPTHPVLVDVPELGYLAVDGRGAPPDDAAEDTTEFQQAFGVLYPVVYTIKFALKREGTIVPILPLEALWFSRDDGSFDMNASREDWGWRALLPVSDEVTPEVFERAVAEVRRKKGDLPMLSAVRLIRWEEGRCAQVMHVGPYAAEPPTIEALHAFIAKSGLKPRDAHHEIYLGDPRQADPAKLRTVLRQPVERA